MSPLWKLLRTTLLTLLALLAAPGGARFTGDAYYCEDDQYRPTMAATTARAGDITETLEPWYGEDIIIFCSSNAANLTIRDDLHQLQTSGFNSTALTLKKPDVGEYKYYCTESNTNCTEILYFDVNPAMSMTSPRIRDITHITIKNKLDYLQKAYFVPHGESYKVFCSAQGTIEYPLRLTVHKELEVETDLKQTQSVNETTVMAIVTDHTEGERSYYCYYNNDVVHANIWIVVENYPEAREFHCVLSERAQVECWWKSSNERNTFKLFMLDEEQSTLVCLDKSHAITAGCAGPLEMETYFRTAVELMLYANVISLQLETCILVFCSNQTFSIDVHSNLKLDPVDDLRLINTSPQDATVVWRLHRYIMDYNTAYKLEYRLLGTDWRSVNDSTVRTEVYGDWFYLLLALPCPGAHYELRVYVRYIKTTGDLYWSDPATIFFFTASSTAGEVDPACDVDFREPPPPLSADALLHEVRELISDERKEEMVLKKRVSDMKIKLAKIKALMNEP